MTARLISTLCPWKASSMPVRDTKKRLRETEPKQKERQRQERSREGFSERSDDRGSAVRKAPGRSYLLGRAVRCPGVPTAHSRAPMPTVRPMLTVCKGQDMRRIVSYTANAGYRSKRAHGGRAEKGAAQRKPEAWGRG